jgi:hypothetical protein
VVFHNWCHSVWVIENVYGPSIEYFLVLLLMFIVSLMLLSHLSQVMIAQYDCGIWILKLVSKKSHPTEKSLTRVYMTWHSIQSSHISLALVLMVLLRCLCNHDYHNSHGHHGNKDKPQMFLARNIFTEYFDAHKRLNSRLLTLVMLWWKWKESRFKCTKICTNVLKHFFNEVFGYFKELTLDPLSVNISNVNLVSDIV